MDLNDSFNQSGREVIEKCIECRKCMKNCPMLHRYCSSPRELFNNIKAKNTLDINIPYSCTMCGYCSSVCPAGLELDKIFLNLRCSLTDKNKGIPPVKGFNVIKSHQRNSFSKLFTIVSSSVTSGISKQVFLPGCSLAAYSPELVIKSYNYLQNKLPGIGIILKCCGNPTHSMGQNNLFKKYYSNLIHDIENKRVDEIITACPSCYKTISQNSPSLKVKSLWEVIAESGIPDNWIINPQKETPTFALHDPCPVRNVPQIYTAVRKIADILGYKIEEFPFSREKTLCCGNGGMVGVTNKDIAMHQARKRVSQVESDYILTYCASCVNSMALGGKESVHILDLIFNNSAPGDISYYKKPKSSIESWMNRYKCKRLIISKLHAE